MDFSTRATTLPHMAKKKTKAKDKHTQPRCVFHLPQELLDELNAYLDKTRPRTNKSEVLRFALENFLEQERKKRPGGS